VLLKLVDCPLKLLACISLIETLEIAITKFPHLLLGLSVLDVGQLSIRDLEAEGSLCDYIPTFPVFLIIESWMICLLNSIA
jgi:hypothetical protein